MSLPPNLSAASFPSEILHVLRTLGAAGHRSWLVGGAPRDLILGRSREGADFDVATPARPEEVQRLFRRVIPTGIEHGTVTVLVGDHGVEVTTFRGEGAYVDGRRPSSVTFHGDVDEDLSRRDFTMNALALDPLAGELRDPFGGQRDLAARVIRAVGDPVTRFAEDGLRPLRAARFAAQLDFTLDRATHDAIRGSLSVTARVAAERVHDELEKLLAAQGAPRGLEILDETHLLSVILPEVDDHPRRAHAVASASAASTPLARTAALLHVLPAGTARAALERLRFSNQVRDDVTALIRVLGCLLDEPRPAPAPGVETRRWLARVTQHLALEALELWRADAETSGVAGAVDAARDAAERAAAALASRPALDVSRLALDGRGVMEVLGTPPGRHVGEALRHLLEVVLEHPERNDRPSLVAAVQEWWGSRNPGVR